MLPMTWQELETLAAAKRDIAGGYTSRPFLEYTEQQAPAQ
jgi:hypothetical protein